MEEKTKVAINTRTCTNRKRTCTNVLRLCVFVFFLFVFVSGARSAQAADLYFAPAAGSFTLGRNFTVTVYVKSPDKAMNAVSGTIVFPADKAEVISLSKDGSVVSFWVQQPIFQNNAGTITFEGVALNPGFQGAAVKVLAINFKTKAAGKINLAFTSAAVLANDGVGTNILAGMGSAEFSAGAVDEGPAASRSSSADVRFGVPGAPQIFSSTHPDPNQWYAKNKVTFNWANPSGVAAVNVLADRNPTTDPGTRSDGLFSSYTYENVDEGVWYFHLRLRNAQGWGAVSHFRFQLDTKPPEPFSITLDGEPESSDPRPSVRFNTKDETSGLDYFAVKSGDETVRVAAKEVASGQAYQLPPQKPGAHTVVVQAFDRAGNVAVAVRDFTILPLESPRISSYPAELPEGEVLKIAGETYPDSRVTVVLAPESGPQQSLEVQSDPQGAFTAIWPERPGAGLYTIAAGVTDSRGAQSEMSEPLSISVQQRPLLRIGSLVVTYLSVVVTLIALLLLLVLTSLYGWYRFTQFRKKLKKEVREVETALHSALAELREDIGKQIKVLERAKTKRTLTSEETRIMRQLKKNFEDAEKSVQQELADVEREIQ